MKLEFLGRRCTRTRGYFCVRWEFRGDATEQQCDDLPSPTTKHSTYQIAFVLLCKRGMHFRKILQVFLSEFLRSRGIILHGADNFRLKQSRDYNARRTRVEVGVSVWLWKQTKLVASGTFSGHSSATGWSTDHVSFGAPLWTKKRSSKCPSSGYHAALSKKFRERQALEQQKSALFWSICVCLEKEVHDIETNFAGLVLELRRGVEHDVRYRILSLICFDRVSAGSGRVLSVGTNWTSGLGTGVCRIMSSWAMGFLVEIEICVVAV